MGTAEEMEAGRKQSEYWANPGANRPQSKPDPTGKGSSVAARKNDNVIPFGPTGNTGGQSRGGGGLAPTGTLDRPGIPGRRARSLGRTQRESRAARARRSIS